MRLKLFVNTALLLLVVNLVQAKPQFGKAILFNENWKFILSNVKDGAQPGLDESGRKRLTPLSSHTTWHTFVPRRFSLVVQLVVI